MRSQNLAIIVAIDQAGGIGIANTLPWHLPEDLAHFKRTTSGYPIIMGRKTFESIGRPLPKRRNIVITRNPQWQHEGVECASSIEDAIALCGGEKAFIIGGAEIFRESIDLVQELVVTKIDKRFECDTFFPSIDPHKWQETASEQHHSQQSALDYALVTYQRI